MNLNNLTIKSQEALQQAQQIAQSFGQQQLENEHIFKAILEVDLCGQFLFGARICLEVFLTYVCVDFRAPFKIYLEMTLKTIKKSMG